MSLAVLKEFERHLVLRRKRKSATATRYTQIIRKRLLKKRLTASDIQLEPYATRYWEDFLRTRRETLEKYVPKEMKLRIRDEFPYIVRDRRLIIYLDEKADKKIREFLESKLGYIRSRAYFLKGRVVLLVEDVEEVLKWK